ncbi:MULTISPECIES: hypothetical protein [Mycobacterium avium complex (MAC)]|uniref:Transmembrane protein n=1 Tax=Mycobacterium intracellulare subsp. chimaera TaxID=222805 RepID=A0ABT7P4D9_MYCIT|nr:MULTISPECIES: hypothetical protein [Mycobacterium avium complex (MAC)]MCF1814683.1 hypothetical protein [Mycobacterium intracellulare subsp. intracellulare]MDM3928162.1 hypothetical protein [Mycobacterium intracellulare subsp. chimaera]MDS0336537.1 hypothetical protein [Mycobacterium intracellulare]
MISGEWMFWRGRPNGGTVILGRSLQVALLLYLIALWLRSFITAAWPWSFDLGALWRNGVETIPWLGAIFGAVYAALYARFSAQWSYLAGFANQLMQTRSSTPELTSSITTWEAAFVEDAVNLHLATKPMFSVLVWLLLADSEVADKFKAYTVDGDTCYDRVRTVLRQRIGPDKLREIEEKDAALLAGHRGELVLVCPNDHPGRVLGILEKTSPSPGNFISYVRAQQPTIPWPLDDSGRFVAVCAGCGATVGGLVNPIRTRMDDLVADPTLTYDTYYLTLNP